MDPTYTPTLKEQIIPLLEAGKTPKEISEIVGCDKGYPYLVRKQMGMEYTPNVGINPKQLVIMKVQKV